MIIDAHAHVLKNPRIKYTPQTTTFMSAADQVEMMDRIGIDKAVILPLSNPEILPEYQGLNEVLEICEMYPGRFIPFCNVDPRLTGTLLKADADHFEFVLKSYRDASCKGLGELSAKIFWDDPRLLNLLEACRRVGFPVTFHTSAPGTADYGVVDDIGFPRFEKILERFGDLFFFGHSQGFWSEISGQVSDEDKYGYPEGPVQPGGAVPRLMRAHPNLYGDLSANSGLGALKRDPEFTWKFIEEFHERLLFGLDVCSVSQKREHIDWLGAALEAKHISQTAYDNIMYKNISRVLNLG